MPLNVPLSIFFFFQWNINLNAIIKKPVPVPPFPLLHARHLRGGAQRAAPAPAPLLGSEWQEQNTPDMAASSLLAARRGQVTRRCMPPGAKGKLESKKEAAQEAAAEVAACTARSSA